MVLARRSLSLAPVIARRGSRCAVDEREMCDRCKVIAIDGSGWPADDGPLCQICWEDDCARSFWDYVKAVEG